MLKQPFRCFTDINLSRPCMHYLLNWITSSSKGIGYSASISKAEDPFQRPPSPPLPPFAQGSVLSTPTTIGPTRPPCPPSQRLWPSGDEQSSRTSVHFPLNHLPFRHGRFPNFPTSLYFKASFALRSKPLPKNDVWRRKKQIPTCKLCLPTVTR